MPRVPDLHRDRFVEHEVGDGDRRGRHTEPDPAAYEKHYRQEHG
jgi:hypothetical protein